MHFALIIDDYLPHSTRVAAKMFHELAKEIMEQGHQVTVITPHFNDKQRPLIQDNLEGITVWRFYSGAIKDVPKVVRAINETLLSLRAWRAIEWKIERDTFDGVIYYSPSIFFGSLVSNIKKRCHCASYLILRDFFPQWAIDSGLIRAGSLIERYFRYFEDRSYRAADTIGVMSQRNLEIFERTTNKRFSASILRNWASLSPHRRSRNAINLRSKLGLTDEIIYFYGGNIGHAQDMANLMRLAKAMQYDSRAYFLFIGQGDEVELIQDLATQWKLNNFSYLPSVNQDEFKDILVQVDVGLFSLSAKHSAHNFPGKLLGYMAESLPILGSVNKGNDLQQIVNDANAGYIFENGEDCTLFDSAKCLLNSDVRGTLGKSSYRLLRDKFSVESASRKIIASFHRKEETMEN
ncbi:MAG: glycosyltransferase WbuB [Vibrio sp. MedPE-SWchi]|nr:MAG: glycosyltransferase WbuB [Vibrio sp. MedPE-SWchi]